MNESPSLVEHIAGTMQSPQLADWILAYLAEQPREPILGFPRDYRSPGPFLVEVVGKNQKHSVAQTFGDASCLALKKYIQNGGLTPELSSATNRVVCDLLYLIESFPCSEPNARDIINVLFVFVASNSHVAIPGEESSVRHRVLRALASKMGGLRGYEAQLGLLFDRDLEIRDTALPAYSIVLQTNPQHAAECLPLVLTTLRQNQMPSRGLMFEIARQLTSVSFLSDTLLWAVAKVGDTVACTDFLDHLEYLGLQRFKERFSYLQHKANVQNVPSVSRENQIGQWVQPQVAFAPLIGMVEGLRRPVVANFILVKLRNPQKKDSPTQMCEYIGCKLGMAIAKDYLSIQDETTYPDELLRESVIQFLNNGDWSDAHMQLQLPKWFGVAQRRLIAANAIRQCLREISTQWEMVKAEFQSFLGSFPAAIVDRAKEVGHLLRKDCKYSDALKVGLSAFPEDQMFFYVLQNACLMGEGVLNVKELYTNWGYLSAQSGSADIAMLNEYTHIAKNHVPDPNVDDAIYEHGGYYVFADQEKAKRLTANPQTATLAMKFGNVFDLGLSNYREAEYDLMLDDIAKKLNCKRWGQTGQPHEHPRWLMDFEQFIKGESTVYVGGSINARLITRFWEGPRIVLICAPQDFKDSLGKFPKNRLIFDEKFMSRLPTRHKQKVMRSLVDLYRSCGEFLDDCARRAAHDETAQKVVRHMMYILAPKVGDPDTKKWNFVVHEEDMVDLMIKDNSFQVSNPI